MVALRLPLYLVAIPGGAVLALLLTLWGLGDRKVSELLYFSWMPLVATVIGNCVLVYQSWSAIQDGQARMTPRQAVAFSFIPFYNLYWVFPVWYGFAQDHNAYIQRHGSAGRPLPSRLYLAHAVLLVLCAIPYVNLVALVPALITTCLVIVYTCRAVDQLKGTGPVPPGLGDLARGLGRKGSGAAAGVLIALVLTGVGSYFVIDSWDSWNFRAGRLGRVEARLQEVQRGLQIAPQEMERLQSEQRYYQAGVPRARNAFYLGLVLAAVGIIGLAGSGIFLYRAWPRSGIARISPDVATAALPGN